MNDLRDLYQEVIFDHNRSPRNFGLLEHPTHQAHGVNPLCGDELTVSLVLDKDEVIEELEEREVEGAKAREEMADKAEDILDDLQNVFGD